ncbi:hypothetical protein LEP1GSC127_3738 [Leptospira kirschneri str. 200801925]|nr:hypothetical protein LEP1GSC127_3738 [Leptospira kirschneri str. 200801925]
MFLHKRIRFFCFLFFFYLLQIVSPQHCVKNKKECPFTNMNARL